MIKKGLIKKLMFSSVLALLCLTPVKAFADDFSSNGYIDNSIDITTFENEATTADKEYVKLRNSLVSKYGYKKAYVMLGSVPVEKKVIPIDSNSNSVNSTSSYLPMAVDPVIDSRVSVPGQVTGKGNLVITIYKNLTSNYMDIWYEMNYTTDTSGVGAKTKGDVMASSFATSNVYKVSTSYSGVIEDYVPYSCGGTGTIKGGSNYARMVFMVKPRYSGVNVSNIYEETNLVYGKRTTNLGDNFSFSVQAGYIGISITGSGMEKYSADLTF